MPNPKDFRTDDSLRAAIELVVADNASSERAKKWYGELENHLAYVQGGIPDKLKDPAFLERLWEDEAVSSTGMGSVKVDVARADAAFRDWFAEQASKPLPAEPKERQRQLVGFYDELINRTKALVGRRPILKVNRVLAAVYPGELTTIADIGKLRVLHRAMGGSVGDHAIVAHRQILDRVRNILGPVQENDLGAIASRIALPWYLYELIEEEPDEETAKSAKSPEDEKLTPLPPIRRRKGLTAIAGLFPGLLSATAELKDGLTRDDLFDYYRRDNPDLKDASISTGISVLCKEFDIAQRDGDVYRLTARGLSLLESLDSDDLADYLLTHILGVDNVIVALRNEPQSRPKLRVLLRSLNPGWTTNFAPDVLVNWLRSMDVLDATNDGSYALTERGQRWAARITWEPKGLPFPELEAPKVVEKPGQGSLNIPSYAAVGERIGSDAGQGLKFEERLVAGLHAGLWSHERRHFAVLTGLSGSGKSQLALNYALALVGRGNEALGDRVLVIPVQPGWYDPTPLLGYVNPLESGYRTAPFLELLQRAADDPYEPYVVVLDEMNLSHPEQYLSPILSAMEMPSGGIDLHCLNAGVTTTPATVKYPNNLAIIGTINIDETTHGLSDKVLDRAFTLEFWDVAVKDFPGWGKTKLLPEVEQQVHDLLAALSKVLSPVRMHFGYRVINDVVGYVAYSLDMGRNALTALDEVVYAKILPKLRGEGSPRFTKALEECHQVLAQAQLGRSRDKVHDLLTDLGETGTAKFWR